MTGRCAPTRSTVGVYDGVGVGVGVGVGIWTAAAGSTPGGGSSAESGGASAHHIIRSMAPTASSRTSTGIAQ